MLVALPLRELKPRVISGVLSEPRCGVNRLNILSISIKGNEDIRLIGPLSLLRVLGGFLVFFCFSYLVKGQLEEYTSITSIIVWDCLSPTVIQRPHSRGKC